jgi:hypothetical protein
MKNSPLRVGQIIRDAESASQFATETEAWQSGFSIASPLFTNYYDLSFG